MGVVTRTDSKYYWLNLERPNQRPIRRPTKHLIRTASGQQSKENRRLAELEYHAAMADLAKGRLGIATKQIPTLKAFLPRYLKVTKDAETKRRLETLFLPAMGHLRLDEIRPAVIASWRSTRKVTDQTIVRDVTALRGLLAKAKEWDVIDHDPLADLQLHPKPGKEIIRYLLPEEETLLFAALRRRDEAGIMARERYNSHRAARRKKPYPTLSYYADWLTPMVTIALYTGIRRGELMQLTWEAIDTHTGTLTVTAQTAKSKKTRHIPINQYAAIALTQWQSQTGRKKGLIFPSPVTGKRMTNTQSSWEEVLENAGITDFRWHDLRHTFASWLVQKGVNLRVVQMLMGHASIKTTEKYAHLAPDQRRAAVEILGT